MQHWEDSLLLLPLPQGDLHRLPCAREYEVFQFHKFTIPQCKFLRTPDSHSTWRRQSPNLLMTVPGTRRRCPFTSNTLYTVTSSTRHNTPQQQRRKVSECEIVTAELQIVRSPRFYPRISSDPKPVLPTGVHERATTGYKEEYHWGRTRTVTLLCLQHI